MITLASLLVLGLCLSCGVTDQARQGGRIYDAASRPGAPDIAVWALEPLQGAAIYLVGEAYNPQRSAWSDGAYKSSINTLNRHFGMDLPGSTGRRLTHRGPRSLHGPDEPQK